MNPRPSSSEEGFRAAVERGGPDGMSFRVRPPKCSAPSGGPFVRRYGSREVPFISRPEELAAEAPAARGYYYEAPQFAAAPYGTFQSALPAYSDEDLPPTETWREFCTQVTPSSVLAAAASTVVAGMDACRYLTGRFVQGIQAPRWERQAGSDYNPHQWKQYTMGGYKYDVVVYRRPKRGGPLGNLMCQ